MLRNRKIIVEAIKRKRNKIRISQEIIARINNKGKIVSLDHYPRANLNKLYHKLSKAR